VALLSTLRENGPIRPKNGSGSNGPKKLVRELIQGAVRCRGIKPRQGQLARLRAASHALRSLRRSSSEVPPQIPDS